MVLTGPSALRRQHCGLRATAAVLPSLAHTTGINGTFWRSDVEVHNPGSEPILVGLHAYYNFGGPPSTAFTLPAGQSRRLEDAMADPAAPNGGTLAAPAKLSSWGGPVLAVSRTYNDTPAGTYGQLIPAFPLDGTVTTGGEARLIHLSGSSNRSKGFRTNIGLVAPARTTADLELWRANGELLQTTTLTWAGARQLNDVLRLPGAGDVQDAWAVVRPTSAGAKLLPWASVVDNVTGDPMFVTAGTPIEPGSEAWIPGAGHVNGYNGSVWRTDLELHNPGGAGATCRIELFPWNTSITSPSAITVTVPAGQSVRLADVVLSRFGAHGGASLRVVPGGGTLMVSARTYSVGPAGTVGQLLPALGETQAITPASPGRVLMLRQSVTRATGYRSNLGLVNTTALQTIAEVELRDASGRLLGTLRRSLGPFESTQLNEVLRLVNTLGTDDAVAVVRTDTAGAALLAYASVVDNRTSDPVLVPALR